MFRHSKRRGGYRAFTVEEPAVSTGLYRNPLSPGYGRLWSRMPVKISSGILSGNAAHFKSIR